MLQIFWKFTNLIQTFLLLTLRDKFRKFIDWPEEKYTYSCCEDYGFHWSFRYCKKCTSSGVMKILLCFFSNKDGLLCFFSNKDGMKKGEGDYNQSIHNIFIAFQALYRWKLKMYWVWEYCIEVLCIFWNIWKFETIISFWKGSYWKMLWNHFEKPC